MQVGIVGLGKMGFNFSLHLLEKGYQVVGFDSDPKQSEELSNQGIVTVKALDKLVAKLAPPRIILLSVPHTVLDEVLFGEKGLIRYLAAADAIIDATNSYYKDSIRRGQKLKGKGINYLDTGVSGGPGGARTGASIMVGGNEAIYKKMGGLFKDLAASDGYAYVGPAGAGHFVKMVHNGIEYALMQAYG